MSRHQRHVTERAIYEFVMLPEEGPPSYHNIFDNLVGYTCINVQVNEQTRKIGCRINISKINNVQTLFKRPKFVHLCHGLELENDVHSCFICYRS